MVVLREDFKISMDTITRRLEHIPHDLDAHEVVLKNDFAHPRNPCERAGWRSFRGKGPDETKERDSRMIEETSA